MNKMIAKTLVAGLACLALCGTTYAAPGRGGKAPQKAPTHQKAPAPKTQHRAPAPQQQHHGAPVAHHAPAPAQHHHTPPPPPAHHHGGHNEGAGWVALGATVIGGIIGGLIGACN